MSLQNSLTQPDANLASTAVPANDPSAVHENVDLPPILTESMDTPEAFVPFSVEPQQQRAAILKWLSQGDYTPDDILQSSELEPSRALYLPVHIFAGQYTAHWMAMSGFDRQEKYYVENSEGQTEEKTRTVTDWKPTSGTVSGAFRVLGYAGNEDMAGAGSFLEGAACGDAELAPFDPQLIGDALIKPFAESEEVAWARTGEGKARAAAESKVKQEIPGDRHKDLHQQFTWTRHQTRPVLLPCWHTSYRYAGNAYRIYTDGAKVARIDGNRPTDSSREKQVSKFFLPSHIIAGSWFGLGLLLKMCGAGIANGVLWSAFFAAIGLYSVSWFRKHKLVSQSLARRQAALRERLQAEGIVAGNLADFAGSPAGCANATKPISRTMPACANKAFNLAKIAAAGIWASIKKSWRNAMHRPVRTE